MKNIILFIVIMSIITGTTPVVFSLPEDGQVESGSATFVHPIDPNTGQADPNTLNILAADNTIINFLSFNIAQNETVNFIQPSVSATVLSRVTGSQESQIYGSLTASGTLFLVNSNGIRFAPTANIQVNNFVASTLDISTNNFMSRNYVFEHADSGKYSQLLNEGLISCTSIALIGSSVNNKGIIIARAGIVHLASGDKTTVAIDQRGMIQVEVDEKTSGKVYDLNGVAAKDAIANSGAIEGVQVVMSAKTADDIFENAVNQSGAVKATGMVEVDGMIRIVADNKVLVSGTMEASGGSIDVSSTASIEIKSDLNAKGELDIKADKDITVEANIFDQDGTIKLYADHDNDGIGSFTQVKGTIEAAGTGDVLIDGSGIMTLNGIIATEYGAIKIGTRLAPQSIEGFPQYVHRKGDINIIEKYDENGTKVLRTDREDVLRYSSQQGITLEATSGAVKDMTDAPIVADSIVIKADHMDIKTQAPNALFYKNSGDLYITASRTENSIVAVEGAGVNVTYIKSANVTFQTDGSFDTDEAVIMTANNLTLIANRIGTYQTPVSTDTAKLTIVKINGDIDIRESLGIGTSMMLRGPPEGGFGQILYPKSANLTLKALAGSIISSSGITISASNITLSADNGNIYVYGTLSAPEGTVTLWTCKSIDIRYGTVISKEGGFLYNPDDEIAVSWIGGTGNWNTGSNWSGGNVPNTNGYNVTIDQLNAVVTMDIGSGVTVGQLTIGSTNTSALTLAGALTLDNGDVTVSSPGSLTIGAFGTLNAAGYAINVAGYWSNSGTFNHGNNTVTFNGTNQFISGNTTFYNLTCVTPGTMLVFEAGSLTTIANTLTIEGAPNNNVILQSSASGTENRFNIYINAVSDSQGNAYLNYITVEGSDALGPVVPIPAHNTNISGDTNSGWDADRYWVGGTGNWSDAANHWAATSGGSPGAGNLPVAGDSVFFDLSSGTGTVTINSAGVSVLDLNETSTNITIATSTNGITVTGNMTVNKTISGATAITFSGAGKTITGGDTGIIGAPLTMGADTIVFVDTGNTFTISGIISGNYNLAKTGAGTLTLSVSNSFSGGLTIKAGTILVSITATPNALGANGNIVTIGDTSGISSATLSVASTTYPQPITVAMGSSGTLALNAAGNAVFFSGAVTLNNDLTLAAANGGGLTMSGGFTGTGNIVTSTTGTGTISISTTSVNNTGTVTNSGSGTGATNISAVIGVSVTGVIQNSATSGLNLSGANTFTGGLTIKAGIVSGSTSTSVFGGSGTGTITIGDTSGSANATLRASISPLANPIIVASGSSGTLSITNTVNTTFSGAITLNNDLTISTASTLTLSGGITGTGNVIISTTNTSTTALSTVSINNIGTITNSGAGSGTTTISAVIGTNVTGVIQNSATSQLTLSGANTFTGGLTIKAGTVLGTTSASAFGGSGTGAITIGDTTGSADAALRSNGSLNHANPITVAAGSGGILSIMNGTTTTFSGAVTLNNNLTLNSSSIGTLILSGGITGTGNIITNAGTGAITIQTTTANMIGTITNSGTGSGTTTISAVIGTNVTGVIQNSTTSQLTLSGANTFTSGLTIKAGTVSLTSSTSAGGGSGTGTITLGDTSGSTAATLKGDGRTFANPIVLATGTTGTLTLGNSGTANTVFSGGVNGTNNLTLTNNSDGSVTLSTATVNNVGTITNAGGANSKANVISSVIGTNVTGVIQDSANSSLTLSGANTFTSGLIIKSGIVLLTTSASAGGDSGTGTITLGDTSGSANATLQGDGRTFANPIVLATGTTGTLTLGNSGIANTVFSGGVTGTNNLTLISYSDGSVTLSTATVNNVGTITNAGMASNNRITTISAVIGTNVTGVIQNSATSKLVLSGNNSSISGDITISAGTLEISGTTVVSLTGSWSNAGVFTANSSTVIFNGSTADTTQTLNPGSSSFYNITINNTGTGTAKVQLSTNALTVTHDMYVTAGTFDPAALTVTGSGTNVLDVTGTIKVGASTFAGSYASFETITLNSGSTVNYSMTDVQTVDNTLLYKNLMISGSGIKTLGGVTTVAEDLTISAGTLDVNNQGLSVTGNVLINGGTLDASDASSDLDINGDVTVTSGSLSAPAVADNTSFLVGGNWQISGTGAFTHNSGRVVFDCASGTKTIEAGTSSFYDLTFTGAGTLQPKTNDITIAHDLTFASGAGTFDNATNDKNINVTGNVTMDNTQTDLGDGTWTVSGNWDSVDVTTLNRNTSVLDMNGSNKTISTNSANWNNRLYTVNISGTITAITGVVANGGTNTISGTLTVNSGYDFDSYADISVSGRITGAGQFHVHNNTIASMTGTIDVATFDWEINSVKTLPAGQYDSATFIIGNAWTGTARFSLGTTIFTGNVIIRSANATAFTVDNGTNNPNLEFRGNVTLSNTGGGTFTWTKGTGTITLGNNPSDGTQTINFLDKAVEDIDINASGDTKQFTDGVTTDSFTLTTGTVDFNGQSITTTGDFTIGTGGQMVQDADAMNGANITVGGNLDLDGQAGDKLTFNWTTAWTLAVTGNANMDYVSLQTSATNPMTFTVSGLVAAANYTDVKYSNSSLGAVISATNSINNGNNQNWNFIIPAGAPLPISDNDIKQMQQSPTFRQGESMLFRAPSFRQPAIMKAISLASYLETANIEFMPTKGPSLI